MSLLLALTAANAYTLTAQHGTYAYAGQAAEITRAKVIAAQAGVYAYVGQSATLLKSKVIGASVGSYAYTGTHASITFAGQSPQGGGPSKPGKGWGIERALFERSIADVGGEKQKSIVRIKETLKKSGLQKAARIARNLEDYSGELEKAKQIQRDITRLESALRVSKTDAQKSRDLQAASLELKEILQDDEDIYRLVMLVHEQEAMLVFGMIGVAIH